MSESPRHLPSIFETLAVNSPIDSVAPNQLANTAGGGVRGPDPFLDSTVEAPDIEPLFPDPDLTPLSPVMDWLTDPESNQTRRSPSVEQSQRLELVEDIRKGLTLISTCGKLGYKRAGIDVFSELCEKIGINIECDWKRLGPQVRHALGSVTDEAAQEMLKLRLAQAEENLGSDHETFMCANVLVAIFYFVPEVLVPARDRGKLTYQDMSQRLNSGRKLLERVLKQRFDDETVKRLFDATGFNEFLLGDDDLTESILGRLLFEAAMHPYIAPACAGLSTY